jgi:hypothetical protein
VSKLPALSCFVALVAIAGARTASGQVDARMFR